MCYKAENNCFVHAIYSFFKNNYHLYFSIRSSYFVSAFEYSKGLKIYDHILMFAKIAI